MLVVYEETYDRGQLPDPRLQELRHFYRLKSEGLNPHPTPGDLGKALNGLLNACTQ
jgi:hypothetical protein